MQKYLAVFILVTMLALSASQSALAGSELQSGGITYYVTWGDSLHTIAMRHGVTVEAIVRQNGLTNPDFVYVGQALIIPTTSYMTKPTQGTCTYHTVRPGETLSGIAWDYNTTVRGLVRNNNLYNKDFVYVGQELCIPNRMGHQPQPVNYQPDPRPAPTYHYHTVAPGETLSSIAYRYGVNYWSIVQANNLSNASYIWAGQSLIIPGYEMRSNPPQRGDHHHHDHDHSYVDDDDHSYADDDDHSYADDDHSYADDDHSYADDDDHSYADDDHSYADDDDHNYATGDNGSLPSAPDYKAEPASALLPRAEYPVTVQINGGEMWMSQGVHAQPDPDGITTLIVITGKEDWKPVRVQSGDSVVKGMSDFSGEFGANRFVFRYAPPGEYDVWVDDETSSQKARVTVGAGERVEVAFEKGVGVDFGGQTFASPDGWILADWRNPSKPGQHLGAWSNILVRTPASGLWVKIAAEGGGYQAKCLTGSKGPNACDFAALGAGFYDIWIDGTDFTVKTYMDGAAYAELTILRQP